MSTDSYLEVFGSFFATWNQPAHIGIYDGRILFYECIRCHKPRPDVSFESYFIKYGLGPGCNVLFCPTCDLLWHQAWGIDKHKDHIIHEVIAQVKKPLLDVQTILLKKYSEASKGKTWFYIGLIAF